MKKDQRGKQPADTKPTAKPADSGNPLKLTLKVIALVIMSIGLMTFWKGITHPPGDSPADPQFTDFITGLVEMGGAGGILCVLAGWFDLQADQRSVKKEIYYGVGAALTVAVGWFVHHYGMQQIGGWDDSTTIEFGWRLFQGQTPNKDFPCFYPPAYILGPKFAFQCFGVSWASMTDVSMLFAAITFAWSLFLLTMLFGRTCLVFLWAVTIQAPTTMMLSFWWYNSITTVACLIYVLSAMAWLRHPASRGMAISYGLALFLLATMKPNTAGILIPLVSGVLLFSAPQRWKMLGLSVVAFGAFNGLLLMNKMSLGEVIKGYLSVAQRGTDLKHFLLFLNPSEKYSILATGAMAILPVLAILFCHRKNFLARRPIIPLVLLVAGCYGFISNSDQYMDSTLVIFAAILLLMELQSAIAPPLNAPVSLMPLGLNRVLAWVCCVMIASGVAQGAAREHVKTAGVPLFYQYDGDKFVEQDGFFAGVHCGVVLHELLAEEQKVLQASPNATVWFGPRIQFSYAAFNKPSPVNQSVWWEPGLSFPKSEEQEYFNRLLASRFDVMICFKNDLTYFSQEEIQRIAAQYDVDQSQQVLTVLRLKK